MDLFQEFRKTGVVPVVVIEDAMDAVPTANALLAGGVNVMEVTFRTSAAEESIRRVAEACPEMLVGAGTVLSIDQAERAANAGAKFIVAPGFDPELVRWCLDRSVPVVPGCVTPSEITEARKLGLRILKFFPANVYGGLKGMKALAGPFPDVRFMPTGGINADNLAEYVSAPFIHAVGGSWLCTKADIAAGNFAGITQLANIARKTVDAVRG